MYNPFGKPQTLGQWMISSVCWVACCLGCFRGSIYSSNYFPKYGFAHYYPILGIAILICVTMWKQVISIGWQVVGEKKASALKLMISMWLLLLTVLLIVSVLSIGFVSIAIIVTISN